MQEPDGRILWLMSDMFGDIADVLPPPPAWHRLAACRGHDPNLWFPTRGQPGTTAKAICASCPVRNECLDWALDDIDLEGDVTYVTASRYGILGGLSPKERTRLARERADQAA